jgi:uncharacterized lipoprotein YajG
MNIKTIIIMLTGIVLLTGCSNTKKTIAVQGDFKQWELKVR